MLKHIIAIARNSGQLPFNPFAGYINSPESVDRGYLTRDEIQRMMDAPMKSKTHELVRDLFIFSVFTGLAYSDVKNLTNDNLQTFFDGNLWIITRKKKPNTESNIRLLDVPKRIVEKYKGMGRDNHVFKVPSNSACNEKLKDIAKQCGIKTRVTYHVARHSAATTILLSNGVPIETVADCWDIRTSRPRRYTPKSPTRRLVRMWLSCLQNWRIWRRVFVTQYK